MTLQDESTGARKMAGPMRRIEAEESHIANFGLNAVALRRNGLL
jgi:hypothetical protein